MSPVTQGTDTSVVDRRMALAREWDDLVAQVRGLDGFHDFLRPPPLETLLEAAADGPVVVVNVSRWRCDALIVRTESVSVRPLPDLTLEEAARRAGEYLTALTAVDYAATLAHDALGSGNGDRESGRRQLAATRALRSSLAHVDVLLPELQEWMWRAVAEPVLKDLGLDKTPTGPTKDWPRLWWCPTGPLSVLPLHAAGHHDDPPGRHRRTVLDRVVSSYTPTLRALLAARGGAGGDSEEVAEEARLLLVSLDDTPGQLPLDGSRERAALRAVPAGRRTELSGPAATRPAVLAALAHHRWVHFSCHGDQDLRDPSRGGLQLADAMLTVADIGDGRFHGDFAGVSACKSAVGGIDLLDEAITLAAALHYTGYRHVVATLWTVDDAVSSEIFTSIYEQIVVDGDLHPQDAAVALHDAVRRRRDADPGSPRSWTPFTHIGP